MKAGNLWVWKTSREWMYCGNQITKEQKPALTADCLLWPFCCGWWTIFICFTLLQYNWTRPLFAPHFCLYLANICSTFLPEDQNKIHVIVPNPHIQPPSRNVSKIIRMTPRPRSVKVWSVGTRAPPGLSQPHNGWRSHFSSQPLPRD